LRIAYLLFLIAFTTTIRANETICLARLFTLNSDIENVLNTQFFPQILSQLNRSFPQYNLTLTNGASAVSECSASNADIVVIIDHAALINNNPMQSVLVKEIEIKNKKATRFYTIHELITDLEIRSGKSPKIFFFSCYAKYLLNQKQSEFFTQSKVQVYYPQMSLPNGQELLNSLSDELKLLLKSLQ
jgi:hypothetical protein